MRPPFSYFANDASSNRRIEIDAVSIHGDSLEAYTNDNIDCNYDYNRYEVQPETQRGPEVDPR